MADPAAAAAAPMTIDFLRARLLSERSVSRASKERADQLAARVAELEEQVRAVTEQRRQAEREAAEVLAVLESRGFCGSLSDVLDSGSEADEEQDEPSDATVTTGDPAPRSYEEGQEHEKEQPPAKGEAKEEEDAMSGTTLQPGGLSWKGRCASPRRARQLKQRHRRSYVYFLASQSDPSPKYRMGQSCRKNKRKELSSIAVLNESRKEQRDGPRCTDDDGPTKFDGEVGGDGQRSSGEGGGQYVIRRDDNGEMERVLEKQAELIGQYEAQEKAQTDWEKKFNDTRSSPNKGDVEADRQVEARSGSEKFTISGTPKNASEEMARTAAISAQGSSTYSTATRRSQDQQGDANSDGCSSHYTNSASSGLCTIKAPSESSKVSDWSSSRFHDHADDHTRSPCQQSSGTNEIDVESVLQALQRARISLRQKLDRPLPPSQVTLALPAPGDEYRADLYDDDDGNSSCTDGHVGSSPSRQEILALGAPEDYHGYHDHDHGREESLSVDGADASLTEKPSSSSPPRQEILALPAPGDREDDDVKIPASSPGLFRLPTDSFPKDETLPTSNGHDFELAVREATRHDTCGDDDAGASARQLYDPHGSAATSGRCSVPASSGFTVGGASFLHGIPGLAEDLRKGGGRLGDADLFMQPRLRVQYHF